MCVCFYVLMHVCLFVCLNESVCVYVNVRDYAYGNV